MNRGPDGTYSYLCPFTLRTWEKDDAGDLVCEDIERIDLTTAMRMIYKGNYHRAEIIEDGRVICESSEKMGRTSEGGPWYLWNSGKGFSDGEPWRWRK